MIIRIVADVIDLWLAASRAWRATLRAWPAGAHAWRAWPGDAMGRLVMAACGGLRPNRFVRLPDPDDPLAGQSAWLIEDPRAGLYLDQVPLRPYAQTLGRIVIARERLPDSIVRHELEHVRQWSRLGPAFLLVYGLESIRAMLAGGDRYRDNRFERQAVEQESAAWQPIFEDVEGDPPADPAARHDHRRPVGF